MGARCLKNCTPSATQSCTQPQGIMDPILQDAQPVGQSMYCFSVYTKDTGSTKQSHELEILQHQHQQQLGIFQCEYSDVFSDISVQVGQGLMTKTVTDVEGDWHFAKRKVSGTWVNTGMFSQIWKQISTDGKYQNADWVLKVDADAIFVPNRMRVWFKQNELVPPAGIYLENCKYVDYGYFGNLEVFSRQAFDITTDGAFPADRPKEERKNKKWKPNCAWAATPAMHPFKKTEEWKQCYQATTSAFGA